METIRLLIKTSRPVSWVNTAYPFAAGYLLLGGGVDWRLVIGSIFFLIPYNLLMYGINDVYDYESDMRNPRKGGIEGAVTPRKFHTVIVASSLLLALPFVLYLLAAGTPASALVLSIVLFFVFAYSVKGLRFKEIPLLDSATSSMHFVGPLLFAFSLTGVNAVGVTAAIAFFCWGMASQAFGAVQDIVPDRQAGIRSIATELGARRTVWFAIIMYAAAVILSALSGGIGVLIAIAGSTYIANIWPFRLLADEDADKARAGWKRFLILNYLVGAVVTMCLVAVAIR